MIPVPGDTASVVIVGGGASGVLLAVHVLKHLKAGLSVTLIEKSESLGRGLAYGTNNLEHILNVPAKGMSAFATDPDHFVRWLRDVDPAATPESFVPRAYYGQYLAQLLETASREAGPGRLHVIQATCQSIAETGQGVRVDLNGGRSILADRVVMAVGHEERPVRSNDIAVRSGSAQDEPLSPDASVLLIGSGLSMVDAWLTLARREHRGPITVVSRHGLIPRSHGPYRPLVIAPEEVPLGAPLRAFVAWFRAKLAQEAGSGGDWRAVVDGLRPYNQQIWQHWSLPSRRQFLRLIRPFWNVHRHRLPASLHQRLADAMTAGQLALIAAEVKGLERDEHGVRVTIRRRGQAASEVVTVTRVYDCGGLLVNVANSSNPVIGAMIATGQARPDALKIGLDVTPDCALLDQAGQASRRVFAIGPITRGQFFEIEAVPDIRVQAETLARRLVAL